VRIYHLVRTLAREHEVTLLALASLAEREAARPLSEVCAAVHTVDHPAGERWRRLYQARSLVGSAYFYYKYHSRELARVARALFARQTFDVVQIEFSQMAYCEVPAGPVRVLDEHNIEHELLDRIWRNERVPLRRVYSYVQARKFRRDELAACRRMDAVLTTSREDRDLLGSQLGGATPIRVVPNGVDTEFFRSGTEAEHPYELLFTGAMNYAPNADGVAHFCADILPRIRAAVPEVSLSVVGRDPPPRIQGLARDGVTITGTVPDVRPWMNRAAVFVVPLRVGGGTRLKILEALASGRAVVSTSLGCEGLDVKDGHNILVADTPAAFADAVVRCQRNPALRRELGARGRALVEERYRWDAIGRGLSQFLTELRESTDRQGPVPDRQTAALADMPR
jgi:glycosyltransferase involved in cell wall biosynthesis